MNPQDINYISISRNLKELASILNLLIGYAELHINEYRQINEDHMMDYINNAENVLNNLKEEITNALT